MKRSISEYETPENLYGAIIGEIRDESVKKARRNFFVSISSTALSFLVLMPAFFWVYSDALQSGFFQSLSLLFSDGGVIASSWKDFASFLVETMPFLSVSVCLAAILALMKSAQFAFKSKEAFFNQYKAI